MGVENEKADLSVFDGEEEAEEPNENVGALENEEAVEEEDCAPKGVVPEDGASLLDEVDVCVPNENADDAGFSAWVEGCAPNENVGFSVEETLSFIALEAPLFGSLCCFVSVPLLSVEPVGLNEKDATGVASA